MTSIAEPTATLDERQFVRYLARETKTNVLLVSTLADEIRRYAAEQGVTLRRVCTPQYTDRSGRPERVGDDIKIDVAAADLIERVILTAARSMRRTVKAAIAAEAVR